jgi:predicted lipoprotein with Yx(FWY)xxD motif
MLPLVVFGGVGMGVALAAPSASTVTIKVSSALGAKVIVNSSGFTLYHYTHESPGSIACTGACAKLWLPLLLSGGAKPAAGPGLVTAKVGTIRRPDGHFQVTYNRLALYRYAADKKPGQTNGQGVGGSWFAVTPMGAITKAEVSAGTPEAASSSTSTLSSSGGGNNQPGTPAMPPNMPPTPANCPPGMNDQNPNDPCYNY